MLEARRCASAARGISMPAVSALSRRAGPRSMVSVATRTAAIDRDQDAEQRAGQGARRRRAAAAAHGRRRGLSRRLLRWRRLIRRHTLIRSRRARAPASTDAPGATATSLTRPALGERSSFSIFIASTTTSGWRRFDRVAGGDQHADDAPGHRRGDLLLAVRGPGRLAPRGAHAPAVDGDAVSCVPPRYASSSPRAPAGRELHIAARMRRRRERAATTP